MNWTLVGLLVLTHLGAFVGGLFTHHWFATKAVVAAAQAATAVTDAAKKL